jgi:hypothetical protein
MCMECLYTKHFNLHSNNVEQYLQLIYRAGVLLNSIGEV